jgi:hypothetical protein
MGKKKTKRDFHVKCFSANIAMQSDDVEIITRKSERNRKTKQHRNVIFISNKMTLIPPFCVFVCGGKFNKHLS